MFQSPPTRHVTTISRNFQVMLLCNLRWLLGQSPAVPDVPVAFTSYLFIGDVHGFSMCHLWLQTGYSKHVGNPIFIGYLLLLYINIYIYIQLPCSWHKYPCLMASSTFVVGFWFPFVPHLSLSWTPCKNYPFSDLNNKLCFSHQKQVRQ